MNNKTNYTAVGAVVVLMFALLFAFGYYLLKPSETSTTKRYAIYFSESVLGLNLDASVKYKGLEVGRVANIGISAFDSEEIEVLVDIDSSTPIAESSVAQLTSQGITGLSYINLIHSTAKMPPVKKGEYPTIATVPSMLNKLENRLDDVMVSIDSSLKAIEELLSQNNQQSFSELLQSSSRLVAKLDATLDEKSIQNVQLTLANMQSFSQKMDALLPRIEVLVEKTGKWEDEFVATFGTIMQSYLGIKESMRAFQDSIESGEFNLKEITSELMPTINTTFIEVQQLLMRVQEVLDSRVQSPLDLIINQEAIKKAPGE